MPQLVLFDDAGGELFRGEVSQEHVERVAHFLRAHIAELRAVAATVRAYRRSMAQLDDFFGLAPAPARSNPRPRRRRAR